LILTNIHAVLVLEIYATGHQLTSSSAIMTRFPRKTREYRQRTRQNPFGRGRLWVQCTLTKEQVIGNINM